MINSKQRMSLYSFMFFILFFNFNNQVFAEKSLLWRISGNGLSKPSYLYGTFHLNYSKLFDIGDSAYIALKNCDAFAGEIYIDSIFIYAMTDQNNLENKYNINYDSLFTKEEKELINKKLIKNTNLNLDEYRKQPFSYLIDALYNTKYLGYQKETILDCYLFYNAKCLGKKLLSLEYFNEYADIMKLLEIKTSEIKETILSLLNDTANTQLIESYLNQDIDEINNFYNTSVDSIFNYKLIIERNKKMIPRMDEMIKKYSMFFAIGAGHLGGSNGLINLLKEKGYNVEPVIKKISNISKKFKTISKNVKWVEYQNSDFGYKVNLPDKPIPMSLNASETITSSNIYVDLGSGIMYNVIAYQFEEKNTDKVLLTFDVIISSMKLKLPDCKEISKNTIKNDSLIGYEIELNSSDNWLKILILKKNYLAYMFITKTNILNKDNYDIDRFYNSIKFIESNEVNWITYNSENSDFSVDLPGKPEYYSLPTANLNLKKIESYSKQNIKEKKEFNIYVYTFSDGNMMKDKEKLRNVIKTDFPIENKYDSTECLINGFNCLIYRTKPNKEQKAFLKMGINFVNSIYILSASNNTDTTFTDLDRFIKSFKINLKSNENLYNYKFNDCSFLLPSEPKNDTALSTNRDDYISRKYETSETNYAQDTTLGFTWIFQIHTFNEFYKSKSDSIAVFKHLDDIRSFTDTLIYSKFYTSNGNTILEFKLKELKRNDFETLGKIIINGRKMYSLYAFALPIMYEKTNTDKILTSFTYDGKKDNWKLTDNKIDDILMALSSDDTLRKNQAKSLIADNKFTEKHLDAIFNILLKNHHDDNQNYSIKSELLSKIDSINDKRTFEFIKDNYDKIANTSRIELEVCELFARIGTNESVRFLINKIKNIKNKDIYEYDYESVFMDLDHNFSVLKDFIPEIFELQKDSLLAYPIVELLNNTLSENRSISADELKKYENQVLNYCKNEYKISFIKDTSEEGNYRPVYKILNATDLLIKIASSQASKDFFKELLQDEESELKMQGIVGLLKNNEEVDKNSIRNIAGNIQSRQSFYESLKEIKKLEFYPEEYKNQKSIAESEFYNFLINDDEEIDTVIFVDEITRVVKGEKKIYYVFKFIEKNIDASYVGWSGPYPLKENTDELITKSEQINTNYEKYDRKLIERNFDSWINEFEKERVRIDKD